MDATEDNTAQCLVITFNCAKLEQDQTVIERILDEASCASPNSAQFVVFCLQEVAPVYDSLSGVIDAWLKPFKDAVSTHKFIGQAISGGCAVLVFTSSYDTFHSLTYNSTAFGSIYSSLKGAALLSILLPENKGRITFISAHFQANEGNYKGRLRDLQTMVEDFNLEDIEGQIIVGGDLNFRTSDGTLATDELSRHLAVSYIKEAPIEFRPTFKFVPNTNEYSDRRNRTPSYCDRVLFFRGYDTVEVKRYDSVMLEQINSDHKPVFASFTTSTDVGLRGEGEQQLSTQRTHNATRNLKLVPYSDQIAGIRRQHSSDPLTTEETPLPEIRRHLEEPPSFGDIFKVLRTYLADTAIMGGIVLSRPVPAAVVVITLVVIYVLFS